MVSAGAFGNAQPERGRAGLCGTGLGKMHGVDGRFNEGPVLLEENTLLFGSHSHD